MTRAADTLPDRLQAIVDEAEEPLDAGVLARAWEYARRAHEGQSRASGDAYVEHPLAVASILADFYADTASLAAALLHDTVEDTDADLEEIASEFGTEVAILVDGLTKIRHFELPSGADRQIETYRKLILSTAEDARVLLIKLADRLHNMRTLDALDEDRRRRIARETRGFYAPMAHRLGMHRVKAELEDLAFRHLEPGEWERVARKVAETRDARESRIAGFVDPLREALEDAGVDAEISGRAKHLWSIYRKMQRREVPFEEIYDALAVRVIVDSVHDCYHALGLVHSQWSPITEQFDDYIARPKSNLYRSLHTVVFGPGERRYEVQIRTREMHETAEYGIAAHWRYKEGRRGASEVDEKLTWFRRVLEWQQGTKDPEEFLEFLKVDLFEEEIFVFTPQGDVQELREGATALDFAFAIHTEVGLRARGAKIDGQMRPLDHELESGDTVEILTDSGQTPSRDWLEFVATSKARHDIRKWLREQEQDHALEVGRRVLEEMADERGASRPADDRLAEVAEELGAGHDASSLVAALGRSDVSRRRAARRLFGEAEEEEPSGGEDASAPPEAGGNGGPERGQDAVLEGVGDLMVSYAGCCQPVPGDEIVGYVTRGQGVTVHRRSCSNYRALDDREERKVSVRWPSVEGSRHPARVRFEGPDRQGLLADVARSVSQSGTNIRSADVETDGGWARGELVVDVESRRHLDELVSRVRGVGGVRQARRVGDVR